MNIWNDPWIPRGKSRKPATPQRRNVILHKVSELINPVDGDWDEDLIKQTFNEKDAEEILQIPISEGNEDWLAWHFDKRGRFSVKSAYKVHVNLIKNEATKQTGEGSIPNVQVSDFLGSISKVKCPPRVHHFIWRLAHNSHSMYMNINKRGVELDTRCSMCSRFFEDGGHIFFRCKHVKAV